MSAKYFVVLAPAAFAAALPVVPVAKSLEPEAPVHYEFQYSVNDTESGDVKQQQESRDGDVVHGSYSLVQPVGVHRIVENTSDAEHGFNANVRYEGQPIQAPVTAKITFAAPVAKVAYSAPIYHSAPVAKVAHSAPIYHAAPVVKMAYAAPLAQVSYSSPAISYHH